MQDSALKKWQLFWIWIRLGCWKIW